MGFICNIYIYKAYRDRPWSTRSDHLDFVDPSIHACSSRPFSVLLFAYLPLVLKRLKTLGAPCISILHPSSYAHQIIVWNVESTRFRVASPSRIWHWRPKVIASSFCCPVWNVNLWTGEKSTWRRSLYHFTQNPSHLSHSLNWIWIDCNNAYIGCTDWKSSPIIFHLLPFRVEM